MRLTAIAPDRLDARQAVLYDDMKAGISAKYGDFTTMRSDGALLGPWNAWLHQPEVGEAFWQVTKAMTAFRKLPDNVRQVVILVVGAWFGASYEVHAHAAVAKKRHGVSDARLSALASGERPSDLLVEEAAALDAAKALLRGGVMPEPTYWQILTLFGQEGVNELIWLVGHYCFVSMTLNGFAIPVPADGTEGDRP